MLSVVALLEDVADHGLLRGQVGTVVERLAPGVCEVEFSDDDGRTYATLSLRIDQSASASSPAESSGGLILSIRTFPVSGWYCGVRAGPPTP